MRTLARGLRLLGHVLVSVVCWVGWLLTRRGAHLLFTHAGDVDREGRDRQMGPLVERLRSEHRPFVEVCRVSLDGGLLRDMLRKRRLYVSWAALLALGRALALWPGLGRDRARVCAAKLLLSSVRPSALFLIDEAGSGQALLRAGRALGIRTLGVQHGDFQPHNPQYADGGRRPIPLEAPDLLALWSPWFQERLFAVSDLHDASNTRVVGRIRHADELPLLDPEDRPPPEAPVRVLLIGEPSETFAREAAPYLDRLRADPGIELRIRRHPGEPAGRWPRAELHGGSLHEALGWSEIVLGLRSSALLEALWVGRPAVCLDASDGASAADYPDHGAASRSGSPGEFLAKCLGIRQAGAELLSAWRAQRERVWGGAGEDPVKDLLSSGT